MIVVSDTGPLNYLILIGHVDILPNLYGQVVVPGAVAQELSRPSAPAPVQAIVQSPPPWLRIAEASPCDPALAGLGEGEQEAITLAQSLKADLLLCDDKDAREAAHRSNVRVIGTIGAIQEAAAQGLLNLADALSKLQQTNFRISRALIESILNEYKKG